MHKKSFKKIFKSSIGYLIVCIMVVLVSIINASANSFDLNGSNGDDNIMGIYNAQLEESGADELKKNLPDETNKILNKLGIDKINFKAIGKLSPQNFVKQAVLIAKDKFKTPIGALIPVVGIVMLSALVDSVKTSFGSDHVSEIMSAVSNLCIVISIVEPIVKTIHAASLVIKSAAGFMLIFTPVIAGIMVASGKTITATSYHTTMLFASQLIAQISANFLVPVISTILGISVLSSVTFRLKLNNICELIHKFIKWLLGFLVSCFVGVLTIQNLVTAPADSLGTGAMKLAISSFVPIIGGALSDAFSTVQGCLKLLKSSVGAFGIIAGTVMFLPIILECVMWIISLNLCHCAAQVFESKKPAMLVKSACKVIETMLAVIISSMTVLIVGVVIMLVMGG